MNAAKSPKSASNGYTAIQTKLKEENATQASAWQNFHVQAQKDDQEENIRILQEAVDRAKDPKPETETSPEWTLQETFKQVSADDDLNREIISITKDSRDQQA